MAKAKAKTGTRRKRDTSGRRRTATRRSGRARTGGDSARGERSGQHDEAATSRRGTSAGPGGTGGAQRGNEVAIDRQARARGATRTARRELSAPRAEDAEADGSNTRSRAVARERDSRAETETAAEEEMTEGDNPRASAEPGLPRARPTAE